VQPANGLASAGLHAAAQRQDRDCRRGTLRAAQLFNALSCAWLGIVEAERRVRTYELYSVGYLRLRPG
jgi:hypothetical protein